MDREKQHDGEGNHEHDSPHRGRDRAKPVTGAAAPTSPPEAKLVQVKGSGLSGPFIRRPVMTVLLTLSVIVAGIATYGKLAVNDLPAVDYPVIQVTCSYPGANPTTMANNIATPLEKQFLQIPALDGEVAARSAQPTDVHENKSKRSGDLPARFALRHADRWRPLQVCVHRRGAAHRDLAWCVPGKYLWRPGRDSNQSRSRGARFARIDRGRSRERDQSRHSLLCRWAIRRGAPYICSSPKRANRSGGRISQSDCCTEQRWLARLSARCG